MHVVDSLDNYRMTDMSCYVVVLSKQAGSANPPLLILHIVKPATYAVDDFTENKSLNAPIILGPSYMSYVKVAKGQGIIG